MLTFDKSSSTLAMSFIERENYENITNRFIAGNARSTSAQNAAGRSAPRMGHCPADSASLAGDTSGGPGVLISVAAPAGGSGVDLFRMGGFREQPEGKILQTDGCRAEAVIGRNRELETLYRSGRADLENFLSERTGMLGKLKPRLRAKFSRSEILSLARECLN